MAAFSVIPVTFGEPACTSERKENTQVVANHAGIFVRTSDYESSGGLSRMSVFQVRYFAYDALVQHRAHAVVHSREKQKQKEKPVLSVLHHVCLLKHLQTAAQSVDQLID